MTTWEHTIVCRDQCGRNSAHPSTNNRPQATATIPEIFFFFFSTSLFAFNMLTDFHRSQATTIGLKWSLIIIIFARMCVSLRNKQIPLNPFFKLHELSLLVSKCTCSLWSSGRCRERLVLAANSVERACRLGWLRSSEEDAPWWNQLLVSL